MEPIDHVMVLVTDLEGAARRYGQDHGLRAHDGGRHAGLGTANAIVPLGDDYIELIAVVDRVEAAGNPNGRYLMDRLATVGEGPVAVCLRTSDAADVADRTGSSPLPMSRTRPDGHELRWELLGMEGVIRETLPFFITWALDDDHPARTPARHACGAQGIAWVELGGEPERVRRWIGSDGPQLRLVGGEPGVHRFAVATPEGDLVVP